MCEKTIADAASDEEIEITPEMIEAGVNELEPFDKEYDDLRDIVVNIYKAMKKSAPHL